jgi:hypothetical protein
MRKYGFISDRGTLTQAGSLVLGAFLIIGCAGGAMESLLTHETPGEVRSEGGSCLYRTGIRVPALRLRAQPSLSSQVRGVLYKGDRVDVFEVRPDGWCRVGSGEGAGWVWGAHLGLPGVFDLVQEAGRTHIRLTDSTMVGPDGILRVYRRFVPPLEKVVVNDPYGTRRVHPVNGGLGVSHEGVDLRAGEGTEVFASAYGKIAAVVYHDSYGIFIDIEHKGGFSTRYAHLSDVFVVEGQVVEKGEPVALSGYTGRTTGPHLHFELIRDGEPVNPEEHIEF